MQIFPHLTSKSSTNSSIVQSFSMSHTCVIISASYLCYFVLFRRYLLILVGGDSGEHGLWKGERVGAFANRDCSDWG